MLELPVQPRRLDVLVPDDPHERAREPRDGISRSLHDSRARAPHSDQDVATRARSPYAIVRTGSSRHRWERVGRWVINRGPPSAALLSPVY